MVTSAHGRDWYEGPKFNYRGSGLLTVNVTGSSWGIGGLPLAVPVKEVLVKHKGRGSTVLDFGTGSWLRYAKHIRNEFSSRELFVVEYDDAFTEGAAAGKAAMERSATFWQPADFLDHKKQRFDLALLINVLNTIPEESHRRSVFAAVADRLNPRGWLVIYQRVWVAGENPPGALEYEGGWIVKQPQQDYCTYRGGDGARWFNEQARSAKVRPVDTGVEMSARNTLLRVWEKPF